MAPRLRLVLTLTLFGALLAAYPAVASAPSPDLRCAVPDALADAGATKAAQAAYIKLLTANPSLKCASTGLEGLTKEEKKPFRTRAKAWLTDVTGSLALLGTLLLIAAALLAFAFAGLTHWKKSRAWLAKQKSLKPVFSPRLKIGAFSEDDQAPMVGAGVTALVRMHLRRLSEAAQPGPDRVILDRVSGTENIGEVIGGLGDLAPQFKALGALIAAVPKLARLPRYGLNGTVQPAGTWGAGITVILDEQHAQGAATTLWAWNTVNTTPNPSTYQALAAGAAGWADFEVRGREGLSRSSWTSDSDSYAYTRAGDALERRELRDDAKVVYIRAVAIDPRNVGAAINLASLHAREGNLEDAIRWLEYAAGVLEGGAS